MFLRGNENKKYAGQILSSLRALNWFDYRLHGRLCADASAGREKGGTENIQAQMSTCVFLCSYLIHFFFFFFFLFFFFFANYLFRKIIVTYESTLKNSFVLVYMMYVTISVILFPFDFLTILV